MQHNKLYRYKYNDKTNKTINKVLNYAIKNIYAIYPKQLSCYIQNKLLLTFF